MRQAILLDGMPIERPVLMKWERLEAAPSWSERMVQAIEVRVQEEWFSLKDKMCSDIALSRAGPGACACKRRRTGCRWR